MNVVTVVCGKMRRRHKQQRRNCTRCYAKPGGGYGIRTRCAQVSAGAHVNVCNTQDSREGPERAHTLAVYIRMPLPRIPQTVV